MGCCLCFFQGSKSWIALLIPILAVFSSFSSGPGILSISITFSLILISLSTLFFSKQKLILVDNPNPMPNQAENSQDKHYPGLAENGEGVLIRSQGFYSESDNFSSTTSEEEEEKEFHSSEVEWTYNPGQGRIDYSDDSVSDEESLIELEIPGGQFVSPGTDNPEFNLKFSKLSADLVMFQKGSCLDLLADVNEMNEEDNLIEIDINMGSIKCSRFEI